MQCNTAYYSLATHDILSALLIQKQITRGILKVMHFLHFFSPLSPRMYLNLKTKHLYSSTWWNIMSDCFKPKGFMSSNLHCQIMIYTGWQGQDSRLVHCSLCSLWDRYYTILTRCCVMYKPTMHSFNSHSAWRRSAHWLEVFLLMHEHSWEGGGKSGNSWEGGGKSGNFRKIRTERLIRYSVVCLKTAGKSMRLLCSDILNACVEKLPGRMEAPSGAPYEHHMSTSLTHLCQW